MKRLDAAAAADFVIVLYNPASKARPWQLGEALDLIGRYRAGDTPVIFARAVTQPDENIELTTLGRADASRADMRTIIIVGSSATKLISRGTNEPFVYTLRHVEFAET